MPSLVPSFLSFEQSEQAVCLTTFESVDLGWQRVMRGDEHDNDSSDGDSNDSISSITKTYIWHFPFYYYSPFVCISVLQYLYSTLPPDFTTLPLCTPHLLCFSTFPLPTMLLACDTVCPLYCHCLALTLPSSLVMSRFLSTRHRPAKWMNEQPTNWATDLFCTHTVPFSYTLDYLFS